LNIFLPRANAETDLGRNALGAADHFWLTALGSLPWFYVVFQVWVVSASFFAVSLGFRIFV
jgi:hypothetical protein